ncbi:MAG: extracellular solute-binding protein [Chloroflexota bacterium]
MWHKRTILTIILVIMMSLSASAQEVTLDVTWVESEACTLFEDLVTDYSEATINVVCVPQAQWFDAIFVDLAAQSGADLLIMDTQFFGTATERNHLFDLNVWYANTFDNETFPEQVLDIHRDDNMLIAMPLQPDVRLLAYRADVYQALGLSAPVTWEELVEQAQLFRVNDDIPFGFVTHWSRQNDYVSSTWNHILWSSGGSLWDEATFTVEDILNTDDALEAVTIANILWQTAPDDALTFTPTEVANAICDGDVAVVELWANDIRQLADVESCNEAENIAYTIVPAGDAGQFTGYGGFGISVSAYTDKEEMALDFLTWFFSDSIQEQWLREGGMTTRNDLLNDEAIQVDLPFIVSYRDSLPLVRDYWQIEIFPILLELQQQYIQPAIAGQLNAEEALDTLATAQQEALDTRYGRNE